MILKAACGTTAMGIIPHRGVGQALELALSLDIPFWPQLPNLSFYEDMYVQASEHFPGIVVDEENRHALFLRHFPKFLLKPGEKTALYPQPVLG